MLEVTAKNNSAIRLYRHIGFHKARLTVYKAVESASPALRYIAAVLRCYNWAWSYVTYRRGARLITGYAAPDAAQALRLQSKARVQTDGVHEVDPGREEVAARQSH